MTNTRKLIDLVEFLIFRLIEENRLFGNISIDLDAIISHLAFRKLSMYELVKI